MRLKHIKIAGFKSFVDPVTLPLPSNLVAVVGPNGCGKSNIIDAVRWVMGESSAKQLRGEAMSDVIFNGSGTRKPIGLASVELEFDNSDGSLGGEYAAYTDINIKRQVTREGDSQYFLNGARCRRRDITHIFLGTGLGPRSYAIIEQGMISRFIEAKPDDMRTYFEEVAGISKYKERRHETELKIKHTQENLHRLTDIYTELEKQVLHLEKQAEAAERYRELKKEERSFRAQLQALRWQVLKKNLRHHEEAIQTLETQLQTFTTQHQKHETLWETTRDQLQKTQLLLQQQQQDHFELGAEIARKTQAKAHAVEREQQLQTDHKQIQDDITQITLQLSQTQQHLSQLQEEITQLQPHTDKTKELNNHIQTQHIQAEQAMQTWQQTWEDYHHQSAHINRKVEIEQTELQHLKQRLHTAQTLFERLHQEQTQLTIKETQESLKVRSEQKTQTENHISISEKNILECKNQIQTKRHENESLAADFNQHCRKVQSLLGKKTSLLTLQENALNNHNAELQSWLTSHHLTDYKQLALALQVEQGWELAVETVLGNLLQTLCLKEWPSLEALFADTPNTSVSLFFEKSPSTSSADSSKLLHKIHVSFSLEPFLFSVFCARDLKEAQKRLPQLQDHESIITKSGIWLGKTWVRIAKKDDIQKGILTRKRELEILEETLLEAQQEETASNNKLKQHHTELQTLEKKLENLNLNHIEELNKLAQLRAQIKINEESLAQQKQRHHQVTLEKTEQQHLQKTLEQQIEKTQTTLHTALEAQKEDAALQQKLLLEKEKFKKQLEDTKQQAWQQQTSIHQLELRLQTAITQQQIKLQLAKQLEQQHQNLKSRLSLLENVLAQSNMPIHTLEDEIHELNQQQPQLDQQLINTRHQIDLHEKQLTNLQTERHQLELKINFTRSELEKNKLDIQGDLVRCTTLEEQLHEAGHNLHHVIQELPTEAELVAWEEQVNKITSRIERLGNINLAAIDELNEIRFRKETLDKQLTDLNDSLNLLQEAIIKIDKETKTSFKDTFDKVNENFSDLFPRLFGGGAARMELTSEDLLTTGISVMAQPPGKRNSHIHLLSGGEKALTATALIFALFRLNPSPFCMLDEVDAPLDDNNVLRFCNLVKELSQEVQFIFISHNKLAIEMGNHLIGVTMKEPGVSRLVSVDIQKAIEMAEAT